MVAVKTDIWTQPAQEFRDDTAGFGVRDQLKDHSKNFKTSWINLGQALFTVWDDKLYQVWGFEKFESYTEEELGLTKSLALKLLKTYSFLEQHEPDFLKLEILKEKDAQGIPHYDAVDVLRKAKNSKELQREDYQKLREDIFMKGKDAKTVRKDLTHMMKEREQLDPEEERDKRKTSSVNRLMTAIKTFQKDMETLKLISPELVKEASVLLKKLEEEAL